MKNINPKALAFWTLFAAVACAGAYAATADTPTVPENTPQEITADESREVADLIQSKPEAIPVPESIQGKNIHCPGETPRTQLVPKASGAPAIPRTAQNS